MRNLKKLLVLAVAAMISAPAHATEMKYPNFYAYSYLAMEQIGFPYFNCDYTSQVCIKGMTFGPNNSRFAGVILDGKDRKTILRHVACQQNMRDCIDFDQGIWSFNTSQHQPLTSSDMPTWCVAAMYERGESCPGDEGCYVTEMPKGADCHAKPPAAGALSPDIPADVRKLIESGDHRLPPPAKFGNPTR